jgi:hypothetical protein
MNQPTEGKTPRTDELLLRLYGTERVEAEKIVNAFARTLELELAARDELLMKVVTYAISLMEIEENYDKALQYLKAVEDNRRALGEK